MPFAVPKHRDSRTPSPVAVAIRSDARTRSSVAVTMQTSDRRASSRERGKLAAERVRVVAAHPLDPASVLGCDQRREADTIVVCRDRREAPTADRGDTAPLSLDPPPRLWRRPLV